VVKNQKVFIDTSNGTGFHKVFELMESYICILTRFGLSLCPWSSNEDIKQDIYVAILEGIPKYDPGRGASLSTFLHMFVKNRLIDCSRKKDPLRSRYHNIMMYEDIDDFYYNPIDPIEKIDIIRRIQCWDKKWRKAIFRVFINEDNISDVARDENMTPWGLSRAISKKLLEARKLG
jgi:DNA-directed RNA polymerase specialized sigma24 family protein